MRTLSLWLPLSVAMLGGCVQGPQGPKGEPGDVIGSPTDGADGVDGQDGADGADGQDGADGVNGADGLDGTDGADGADGQDGVDGADGQDGQDGPDGQDGQDGQDGDVGAEGIDGHDGDGPWGVVLRIDAVTGGTGLDGQLQPGDIPVVRFTLVDDAGAPYDLVNLSGLSFQIAGPSAHRQVLVDAGELGDTLSAPVYEGDGAWTYAFAAPVPDVYQPVANDTPDLGEAEGDWGGLPIQDGTYSVAGWAWLNVLREDGSTWYDGGGGAADVLVGAATVVEPRELVTTDACVECHGYDFQAHGGMRRDVEVCAVCHVAGAEDRHSTTDSSTTPGATIAWPVMIHQIHAGSSLSSPLTLNGYPADDTLDGWPDYNTHDYSTVNFPRWPMGVAECAACHTAEGPPPTRAGCGACHEDVDWVTGDGHTAGAQPDDEQCALCHSAEDIDGYHVDPRDVATLDEGFQIEIVGLSGGSGSGGQALPGDVLSVEFHLTQDDGTWYTASAVDSLYLIVAGPLDHLQQAYKDTSFLGGASTTTTLTTNDAGDFVASFEVPALYPAQENNTADLGEADGDWGGLPVQSGTWRLALGGYRSFLDADGSTVRHPASAVVDFLLGEDSTTLETRDVVVEASCQACHGELLFHGDGRTGYAYCVTCHTAGAEDRYSSTDASVTPGVTIAWPTLVHKIHNGANLSQTWEVAGYSSSDAYTLHTYGEVDFPRMDGGAAACLACHDGSDAYQVPSASLCLTCHDSPDASAHAALNTDGVYGESCDVCHAAGSTFDVESVHDPLR